MEPVNDEGDETQVIQEGHDSAGISVQLGNHAFDHRLNDDQNGLDHSYDTSVDYEPEGKHKPGVGFEVGYLPPDQRPGLPTELLSHLQIADPEIGDDTEAAEALRANANVKVGKVGKVARSVGAQSVRKVAKRLTLRAQSGNRRGCSFSDCRAQSPEWRPIAKRGRHPDHQATCECRTNPPDRGS